MSDRSRVIQLCQLSKELADVRAEASELELSGAYSLARDVRSVIPAIRDEIRDLSDSSEESDYFIYNRRNY